VSLSAITVFKECECGSFCIVVNMSSVVLKFSGFKSHGVVVMCELEDPAAKYFSPKVTERERAAFEAGIALGMVIHQFTGIPVRFPEQVKLLERVIEYAIMSQPFKKKSAVRVSIEIPSSRSPYAYTTLRSKNLDVTLTVEYGKAVVKARLHYIPELDYTLAYIEDISEKSGEVLTGEVCR